MITVTSNQPPTSLVPLQHPYYAPHGLRSSFVKAVQLPHFLVPNRPAGQPSDSQPLLPGPYTASPSAPALTHWPRLAPQNNRLLDRHAESFPSSPHCIPLSPQIESNFSDPEPIPANWGLLTFSHSTQLSSLKNSGHMVIMCVWIHLIFALPSSRYAPEEPAVSARSR